MAITKIGTTGISNNLDVPGYLYLSGDNKELRFYNGANYMILKASGSLSNNYTITLPVDDGTTGQFLKTNGSGVTSWDTVTSSALSTKRVYTSYTQGTTSDPQTISGAGFQPTKVEIIASTGGTSGGSSIGHSDSSNSEFCTSLQSNGYYGARDGRIVHISNGSWSLYCNCTINSDGCVLDWTAEVSGWATIYLSVMFSR